MNKSELQVIHETNHYIVVIKPSGILSQADSTGDIDMLSLVREYLRIKYNKPGEAFVGLVHRLDRMTSGIMVFAKTSKGASRLNEQIKEHLFYKKYYALVSGHIDVDGTFVDELKFDEIKLFSMGSGLIIVCFDIIRIGQQLRIQYFHYLSVRRICNPKQIK